VVVVVPALSLTVQEKERSLLLIRLGEAMALTALGRGQFVHEQSSWQRLVDAIVRSLVATPQEI